MVWIIHLHYIYYSRSAHSMIGNDFKKKFPPWILKIHLVAFDYFYRVLKLLFKLDIIILIKNMYYRCPMHFLQKFFFFLCMIACSCYSGPYNPIFDLIYSLWGGGNGVGTFFQFVFTCFSMFYKYHVDIRWSFIWLFLWLHVLSVHWLYLGVFLTVYAHNLFCSYAATCFRVCFDVVFVALHMICRYFTFSGMGLYALCVLFLYCLYLCKNIYIFFFLNLPCTPGRTVRLTPHDIPDSLCRYDAAQTSWAQSNPGGPCKFYMSEYT